MDGSGTELVQDNLIIGAVPSTMIDLIWDKVEPMIEMVKDKAPEDIDVAVIKDRLLVGDILMVTVSRGTEVIALNIVDVKVLDTGVKALYSPVTAGTEMEVWLDRMLEILVAIAKDYGCTELRGLAARDGWLRKLKPYGWEEVFTTIRYKIGE